MASLDSSSLLSWTRPKNDAVSSAYDIETNDELFRFMTFSPDYIKEGSCVAGNPMNCATFASQDISRESRIGKLSNLNENQRSKTNNKSLGIRTSPDFSTGPLVDPRMINDMTILEGTFQQNSRVNMSPGAFAAVNTSDAIHRALPPLLNNSALRQSTRVMRRNEFARRCAHE